MNVTLPGNPALDIASSTGQGIASYATPAEVLIGILLAFLVLGLIIEAVRSPSTPTHDAAQP